MTFKYELYVLKGMIKDKMHMLKPLIKFGLIIFFMGDVVLFVIEKLSLLYMAFWLLISMIISLVILLFFCDEDLDTIYIKDT